MNVRGRRHLPFGPTAVTLLVTAGVWELAARAYEIDFLPPLSAILVRLTELTAEGVIVEALGRSLTNLAIGLAIAIFFGTGVGALMGIFERADDALGIYVDTLLTTPSLIFAPIFFAIWGLGSGSIIALIVIYATPYIVVNTQAAMKAAPVELLEMARSYGASGWTKFKRIRLPAATPLIMAGMRVAVARAVKGMINGEMFIAVTGLGAVVVQAGSRFDATTVLAVLFVICVVAYLAIEVVRLIDRRLTSWLPSTERIGGI